MADFPVAMWLAMALVGVGAVVGSLYVLATYVRNEVFIHNARIKVVALRQRYARQVEAEEAGGAEASADVIVLPEPAAAGTEPPQRRMAA